eukprot:CAMPEP_0117686874 /NCGR_PEP_ID=MMETSP0804-20121206/22756_1 /TAXON_ID=1074897 /ORGANISM="Tetraselmis astigmatica, Strain CCMP880" /LENGTH=113 /DNA_ID=CAMNT_0005498743 /DNA_START=119 /DNA_END=457 /DNA_ORIENTATION=-
MSYWNVPCGPWRQVSGAASWKPWGSGRGFLHVVASSLERIIAMLSSLPLLSRGPNPHPLAVDFYRETSTLKKVMVSGKMMLNQYMVIKTLGKGNFGTVRLCFNLNDKTLYAIK